MNHLAALLSPPRIALGILLALAASLTTLAQTIEMNPTDGPYGGTVVDVQIDRDGSLFAATAVGLFRSTDDGVSWEMNAFDGINVRYLRRDSVGFIYAGTDSGLYRSGDWGARWSRYLGEFEVIHDIAFHANGSIFFAHSFRVIGGSNFGSIQRSTDGGNSWDSIYGTHWVMDPTLIAAGDTTIFLNDPYSGLFKSTDNGETWCALITAVYLLGLPQAEVYWGSAWLIDALIPIGTGDTVLTAMVDSTQLRWSCDMWDEDEIHNQRDVLCFIEGSDNSILAGTRNQGILRTTDLGESWRPFIATASSVNDMVYSSTGDLIVGTANGIVRVDAGSGSALPSSTGLTGMRMGTLAIDSAGGMLAGTDVGIWRTADKGETWTVLGLEGRMVNSIKVAPNGTIYAGTTYPGLVARSVDGGVTWQEIARSDRMEYSYVTILDAYDSHVLFGTSRGFWWLSREGTESLPPQIFTLLNDSDEWVRGEENLRGISTVREAAARLYASFESTRQPKVTGLYISKDSGATFTLSDRLPADRTYRFLSSPDDTLYALADDGTLFRSDWAGVVWTALTSNLPGIINLPTANSRNELYLLQNGKLYRSIDKGSFWEEIDTDLPTALAVTAVDRDGYLYAGGDGLRVYRSSMTTVGVDDEEGALEPNAMTVAPNPSGGEAELRFHLEERGEVHIRVVDMKGKVHIERRMMAEKGELLERLDLSALPSGAYTVVVEQGEKRMEKRILVVR